MDKNELKIYLKDNPEYIREVLEEIGCTNVKVGRKRISACRPVDGDNKGAISIRLNDFLSTNVYTKPEFQKYTYRDIYTLLEFLCKYNLHEALVFIHKICGLSYDANFKPKTKSNSYAFIKKFKRNLFKSEEDNFKEIILDEEIMDQFYREECGIFSDDGINSVAQDIFQVSYDVIEDRIVFPIRNCEGSLVSVKGRTCNEKYKIWGISKYLYYYNYVGEKYLYGYFENEEYIKESKEIYIFEAEKSVMQLASNGIRNALAVCKKVVSPHQLRLLLKLGKDIVLCFDKDVTEEEIREECRKFKKLCKVYYILDEDNLLKDKDSPSDKGIEVFNELLKNKILFEEGINV